MQLIEEVAGYFRKANLAINFAKSKFCMREIKYLGFITGDGQLKADPGKISAVKEFPKPITTKQLRRFLGLAGWYRRFVDNNASITRALTDLLRKKHRFEWTEDADLAFNQLKDSLTSSPVLRTPNFSKQFILLCDASLHGIGCVLAQVDEEGTELPIAYMSEKLLKAQQNFSVTELERLAVIRGI